MSLWEILVLAGCLVVSLLLVSGALAALVLSNWRFRRRSRRKEPTTCVYCQGTGSIAKWERTVQFGSDGFIDADVRLSECAGCDGTGVVHR